MSTPDFSTTGRLVEAGRVVTECPIFISDDMGMRVVVGTAVQQSDLRWRFDSTLYGPGYIGAVYGRCDQRRWRTIDQLVDAVQSAVDAGSEQ